MVTKGISSRGQVLAAVLLIVGIATAIIQPHVTQSLNLDHSINENLELREIQVQEDWPLAGQLIREDGAQEPSIFFVGVRSEHGELVLRPGGYVRVRGW